MKTNTRMLSERKLVCFQVGAMAHGKIDKDYADDFISSNFFLHCFLISSLYFCRNSEHSCSSLSSCYVLSSCFSVSLWMHLRYPPLFLLFFLKRICRSVGFWCPSLLLAARYYYAIY